METMNEQQTNTKNKINQLASLDSIFQSRPSVQHYDDNKLIELAETRERSRFHEQRPDRPGTCDS